MKILYEDDRFKLDAIYESAYVLDKRSSVLGSKNDRLLSGFVGYHYGEALSGIVICHLPSTKLYEVGNADPENLMWTNALHQDSLDQEPGLFRFVSYNDDNLLCVFRMSAITRKVEQLD